MGIRITDIRYMMVNPYTTEDYIKDKTIGQEYDPGLHYRFNLRIRLKKRSVWIYFGTGQRILTYFIPKWYKEKYKDRILNRKHVSGYWFDFIFPRCIVPHEKLYRWLNFYFKLRSDKVIRIKRMLRRSLLLQAIFSTLALALYILAMIAFLKLLGVI